MNLYEMSALSADISLYGAELQEAMRVARNRKKLTRADFRRVGRLARWAFSAVNPHSRRAWAETICTEIEQQFVKGDGYRHQEDLLFVTLTDVSCTTAPSERLSAAKLGAIKNELRGGLRGFSYLAFVEPAYYVNLQNGTNVQGKQCIYWHVHALVWGSPKRKVRKNLASHRKAGRYKPIADGLKSTKVKEIKQGTLPRMMNYILKAPTNGYRVIVRDQKDEKGIWVTNKFGEVLRGFEQRKAKLRPGERVTLLLAMKELRLDELTMSGGAGVDIMRRVRRSTAMV